MVKATVGEKGENSPSGAMTLSIIAYCVMTPGMMTFRIIIKSCT